MEKHTYYECKCNKPYCQFCDGGLGLCTSCNGFEGTLTTECCGRRITEEEERLIYNERVLDYVGGKWLRFDEDCIIDAYEGYSEIHNITTMGAEIKHKDTNLIFRCSDAPDYNSNLRIVKLRLTKALSKL
jgi:hypothetical protein